MQLSYESGDEEDDEEEEFHPSEGSENEMETELLDYVLDDTQQPDPMEESGTQT